MQGDCCLSARVSVTRKAIAAVQVQQKAIAAPRIRIKPRAKVRLVDE
jgi:hypothetical protein